MDKIRALLIKKPEEEFNTNFNSHYLFTEEKQLAKFFGSEQDQNAPSPSEIISKSSSEEPEKEISQNILEMSSLNNKESDVNLKEDGEPSVQARWEILFLINRMLLKTRPYDSIEFFCLQRHIRRYLGLEGKMIKKRQENPDQETGHIRKMCCFKLN